SVDSHRDYTKRPRSTLGSLFDVERWEDFLILLINSLRLWGIRDGPIGEKGSV
ncbi:Hypothetical predicted protein, partial [Xyrichtys novacula]